jgi:hypothetical protein
MHLVEEEVAVTEMGTGTSNARVYEGAGSGARCPECGSPDFPAALQDESGSAITLRCFVRQVVHDLYIAECIDLDLGVEAETEDAAIAGLHDEIIGYLLVVLEGVETEQEVPAAVLRPAPISHRIRYYFEYAKLLIAKWLLGSRPHPGKKFYQAPYGLGGSGCPAN